MSITPCGWEKSPETAIISEHHLNPPNISSLPMNVNGSSENQAAIQGVSKNAVSGVASVSYLTSASSGSYKSLTSPSLMSFTNGQPRFPHPINFLNENWNNVGLNSKFLVRWIVQIWSVYAMFTCARFFSFLCTARLSKSNWLYQVWVVYYIAICIFVQRWKHMVYNTGDKFCKT